MTAGSPNSTISWRGDMHMGRLETENNSATLLVEASCLTLDGPRGYHLVLPKEKITGIRQAIGKFWKWSWLLKKGIRIYHTVSGLPEKLVFRSAHISAEHMLKQLKSLEYHVP